MSSESCKDQIKTDHDVLMKLATDMVWVKRILFVANVPVVIACLKFLLINPSG